MAVRISITDVSTGYSVDVDVEPWNTIDELVESVATFWEKDLGAYCLKWGTYLMRGETPVSSLQLTEGTIFEFIQDPEGG
jgi:hypothetical protein